jgi:hypothetical protein
MDDHGSALGGEMAGDGSADALGSAGDKGDLVQETLRHVHPQEKSGSSTRRNLGSIFVPLG